NGYISFREFLNAVVLFSKGTIQEKLQTMFYMYDIDGTGYMSQTQIAKMFRSKEMYSFKDFCQLLSPQVDTLWDASFDWKGKGFFYF
ncbi:dual oxidase 1-like, partial [Elysia marginata]